MDNTVYNGFNVHAAIEPDVQDASRVASAWAARHLVGVSLGEGTCEVREALADLVEQSP